MDKAQQAADRYRTFPWKHAGGYVFSIILTVLAVMTALNASLPVSMIMPIIYIFAILQAALQLFMFMHMTESSSGKVQAGTVLFALFIAITLVAGSVWVLSSGHT
jgi:cytochrome aa3-600 menaquinol oxidase subunit 4